MPPSEYSFRLQHGKSPPPPHLSPTQTDPLITGIAGGFAPPTPSAIYTITAALNLPHLTITSALRPHGTPTLLDSPHKSLPTADAEAATLVDELHGILRAIPTEVPPGSEDIYGLDTSIAWGSEDLQWMNGGPQGCGGGRSEVRASEEEKGKFRRAVEIVNRLVEKAA